MLKIKAIYHTMNMFNSDGQNYIAECWLPQEELGIVQSVIQKATVSRTFGKKNSPMSEFVGVHCWSAAMQSQLLKKTH